MSRPTIIDVQSVTRSFGSFTALDSVDVAVGRGEFFSLLGPSGCGKTTLLRLIGGFDDPSAGRILIDGEDMAGVPANLRPTNMVFQSYAIFPHLSVADNVAYGLRRLRLDRVVRERKVAEALGMVGLEGLGPRRPNELSGGQRQRVALARALILEPKVLLLDEPLSALDKKLREQMQGELRRLQRAVGITFVLVTHDQYEALSMSDRIALMFEGRIGQVATPQEIYARPASRRVAAFIGGMNFVPAQLLNAGTATLELDTACFGRVSVARPAGFDSVGAGLVVGVRPERLRLGGGDAGVAGEVVEAEYFGESTHYAIRVAGCDAPLTVAVANARGEAPLAAGATVSVAWEPDALVPLR